MADAFQVFDVVRVDDRGIRSAADHVAAEQPLEVRLEGHPFSVIMRTPGADEDLALGFLYSESVILRPGDVRRVERTDSPNVINVRLSRDRAEILPDLLGGRRQVVTNSSCGMCGRRTLESLIVNAPPLRVQWTVDSEVILNLPATLRAAQPAFSETGGLHAAGLFDAEGCLELSAEDVGRHNAVDKVIGRAAMDGLPPLRGHVLLVSGRTSFEITQKALVAGIPVLAAVSAPSSLAVRLARDSGMTLIGFLRDGAFNVYSGRERVAGI